MDLNLTTQTGASQLQPPPDSLVRQELLALAELLQQKTAALRAKEQQIQRDKEDLARIRREVEAQRNNLETAAKAFHTQDHTNTAAAGPVAIPDVLPADHPVMLDTTKRIHGLQQDARRLRRILQELRQDNQSLRQVNSQQAAELERIKEKLRQSEGRVTALRRSHKENRASVEDAGKAAESSVAEASQSVLTSTQANKTKVQAADKSGSATSSVLPGRRSSAASTATETHQQQASSLQQRLEMQAQLHAALVFVSYALQQLKTQHKATREREQRPALRVMEVDTAFQLLSAGNKLLANLLNMQHSAAELEYLCSFLQLLCDCLRVITGNSRRQTFLSTLRRLGEQVWHSSILQHHRGQTATGAEVQLRALCLLVVLQCLTQADIVVQAFAMLQETLRHSDARSAFVDAGGTQMLYGMVMAAVPHMVVAALDATIVILANSEGDDALVCYYMCTDAWATAVRNALRQSLHDEPVVEKLSIICQRLALHRGATKVFQRTGLKATISELLQTSGWATDSLIALNMQAALASLTINTDS